MPIDQKKLTEANLTVGYVAKRSGVKVSTLHFYETKGLIRSWRNVAGEMAAINAAIKKMYCAV